MTDIFFCEDGCVHFSDIKRIEKSEKSENFSLYTVTLNNDHKLYFSEENYKKFQKDYNIFVDETNNNIIPIGDIEPKFL